MCASHDVRLDGVTKRFDDVVAVDDVSLDIEEGTFLTLLGPSGCGKTTTLRMIAGFETPSKGEVLIRNERVNEIPPFERDTSMVFQSYALFPHMDVGENIAFGLQMQGVPGEGHLTRQRGTRGALSRLTSRTGSEKIDAQVQKMLDLIELPDIADRPIEQLSGGQKQRVALARALVTEPTVLLLDEPLGALDLKLRKNMQVELKNLQEELGLTFVYVTHDQEEALTMSDQIAVMNDGQIEQLGSVTEIYEEPASEFVADFIGETNLIRGEYTETDAGATLESDGLTFRVPRTPEARGSVAFAIRPEKLRLGGDARGLDNTFAAEVVEEIYKGNRGKFVVTLENGQEMTIDLQIREQGQYLSVGEDVTIGWSKDNSIVLTR